MLDSQVYRMSVVKSVVYDGSRATVWLRKREGVRGGNDGSSFIKDMVGLI